MTEPIRLLLIGAGNRGAGVYGAYCLRHPDAAQVVAIADLDEARRARVAGQHAVPPHRRYECWSEAFSAEAGQIDAVVIATPDREHVAPAIMALDRHLDVLLEKPIAPDPDGVVRVVEAAARSRGTVTVAHVLRYTPFFGMLKSLMEEGVIGDLVGIEHTENVGYWHFAHSYVRGPWRREEQASPMILAKACHDLDLLRWFAGASCSQIASFGGLHHFRADQAPEGAPERCLDGCVVEATCPYHAGRFYVDELAGWDGPPVSAISDDPSPAGRLRALAEGPYGRCVYRCDNDVADHQVTILEFENGVQARLTVSAFTEACSRTVRLHGTAGELAGDLEEGVIELRRFLPASHVTWPSGSTGIGRAPTDPRPQHEVMRIPAPVEEEGTAPARAFIGHAGGDEGLLRDFVDRLRRRRAGERPEGARTSLEESLESHLLAFAAERSRRDGLVVHSTAGRVPIATHQGGLI